MMAVERYQSVNVPFTFTAGTGFRGSQVIRYEGVSGFRAFLVAWELELLTPPSQGFEFEHIEFVDPVSGKSLAGDRKWNFQGVANQRVVWGLSGAAELFAGRGYLIRSFDTGFDWRVVANGLSLTVF